jgi:hypothetical protein
MKPLDVLLILVSVLFITGLISDNQLEPERREHRERVRVQRKHLDLVADYLRDYHEATGRYPTMEEGLDAIPRLRAATFSGDFARFAPALAGLPGVRTPHGVPYVYENRRDSRDEIKGAFKNSPARFDDRKVERFSRKIDDGVFVTSLGLRHDVDRVFGKAWTDALVLFVGGAVLSLVVAYVLFRNRNRDSERYRGVNATIIVGVAVVLAIVFALTGGQSRLVRTDRPLKVAEPGSRSDLAREFLELHREWATSGVLAEDAYQALAARLTTEFRLDAPLPTPAEVPRKEG